MILPINNGDNAKTDTTAKPETNTDFLKLLNKYQHYQASTIYNYVIRLKKNFRFVHETSGVFFLDTSVRNVFGHRH